MVTDSISDRNSIYETITLEKLRREEARLIAARRIKAEVSAEVEEPLVGPPNSERPPRDLVGLALSGGGIRSSMFNTGVLQGLEKIGLLKHVDYLATVSGGGFIGGFITSQYQKRKDLKDKFPLKKVEGGGQNAAVNQLTRSGEYLKNPIELTLRVASGVVLHLLIIASILILSCSAISWLWRLPDMSSIQRHLAEEAMRLDRSLWRGAILFPLVVSWLYLAYYSSRARRGELKAIEIRKVVGAATRELWTSISHAGLWKIASIIALLLYGIFLGYRWSTASSDSAPALVFFGIFSYVIGLLERKLAKQAIMAGTLFLFIAHEGGFFAVCRDWFALSDLVRALIPFVGLVYLFGILEQARKVTEKNKAEEVNKPKGDNKTKGESKNRGLLAFPFFILVGPPLLVTTYLSYASAFWHNWHVLWDVLVFMLAWTLFFGVTWLLFEADPSKFLNQIRPYKNPLLVVGFFFTVLTLLANGDTDVGPRIGHILRRLLPGLGQEVDTAAGQVSLQMRNNASFRQWISTVTQYLVFIQLISGVIPLLLPRQFASSGQADAGGFSRSVYRGIIFLLFVSLPLVICFLFLRENLSGAVQIPSPIKRLAVSRDPITGVYGYLIDHDQWTRFRWFIAGLAGFLALNWFVDLNKTSLHRYYRRRLKAAYFSAFPDWEYDPNEDDTIKETRLHEIKVGETGAPYPLMVATLNEARPGSTSVDSGCAFIFSPLYCGWSRNPRIGPSTPTHRRTEEAEPPELTPSCFIQTEAYPGLRLVDAMAISGAAITPSNSRSILDTILLLAANARLGQWLVNPKVKARNGEPPNGEEELKERKKAFVDLLGKRGHGIPSVSAWRLMASLLKSPTGGREFCFISDGAHYDNLGMETLFERRCRLIVASDASHDPRYEFRDLSKTLRRLRAFKGIEFFLDRESIERYLNRSQFKGEAMDAAEQFLKSLPWTAMLAPKDFLRSGGGTPTSVVRDFVTSGGDSSKKTNEPPCCRSHHLVFAFCYPDDMVTNENQRWGLLIVLKPSLNGDEDSQSAGLYSFARSYKTFPMDGDMNQFFDENQCEYYRELGEIVTDSIFKENKKIGSRERLDTIMKNIIRPQVEDKKREGTETKLIMVDGTHLVGAGNGKGRTS